MRTILATLLTVLLLLPVAAIGEIQTITQTVKQAFGGSQSADDARIAAIAKAKREALEMAGVYVEALTIVKDAKVDKDEILALTAGVLQAEVISQKNYVSGDGFGIEVVVKVNVDPSILEDRVRKMLQDKTHIEQLKQSQSQVRDLLQRLAKLEEENRQPAPKSQDTKKLKKQFQKVSRELTALEWLEKAQRGEGTGPLPAEGRIKYLNEAIRLYPDFLEAYKLRGEDYSVIEQYDQAIQDYNQVIRLAPRDSAAYYRRAWAYLELGQQKRAFQDFSKAIKVQPDNIEAYNQRAEAYLKSGKQKLAFQDLDEAVRRNPHKPAAYHNRGVAYNRVGQYKKAILDYDALARLIKPYSSEMPYWLRAEAYANLGDYPKAIENYNVLIDHDHDWKEGLALNDIASLDRERALEYRGDAYDKLGQYEKAIKDYSERIRVMTKALQMAEAQGFDSGSKRIARAYYDRGYAYDHLELYKLAIADYDEAIRLKPDYAEAHNNRGVNGILLGGNKQEGCSSLRKACELGVCIGYKWANGKGYCR